MASVKSDNLGVGFSLQSDIEFIKLTANIIEHEADYYEIAPETLWDFDRKTGELIDHPIRHQILEIFKRSKKPFVAHGLDFSIGTPCVGETEQKRTRQWLDKIARDHESFKFEWYTEHLGFSITAEGLQAVLPLPLPHTDEAVSVAADRLNMIKKIVPAVGFENSVFLFLLGDPMHEADLYNQICNKADCNLLLDLHNVYTHSLNFEIDPYAFVRQIDLDRVIQIHISGGSESDPDWVSTGKTYRLDSHDGWIPETVWDLYENILPLCKNLRGVVVERLDGTLEEKDVPPFESEFRRAKQIYKNIKC